MKRLFPLSNDHALLCHLFAPRSVEESIAEARNAAGDGAEAIAVELLQFPVELRTIGNFRRIVESVDLPFMFLDYRNDRFHLDDEERMAHLLVAAEAGAGMIDIVGDLFGPAPDERGVDPAAVARQAEAIRMVHETGSQVIISSHPQRYMKADAVEEQLRDFASRGGDVVKLVARADSDAEYLESLATTVRLYRNLATPFVYLCCGRYGRLQRMTSLQCGGAITFGVYRHHDFEPYDQPEIRDFAAVRKGIGLHLGEIQLQEK
ncbi:MAG: type I 3-dehydroquinate dehydratase [Victivallaceae bacterium]|nr:type I 3-dehydroquinate dehydratase [Victivallaceae bacterium]